MATITLLASKLDQFLHNILAKRPTEVNKHDGHLIVSVSF